MPLAASGRGGLVHDPQTHALLLVAQAWRLQPASEERGEPAMLFLAGCRVPPAVGVVGGDGGAFEASYLPVRCTLPFGTRLLVINAELNGDTAAGPAGGNTAADFEALATSLPVPDLNALDEWGSPAAVRLPLPDGGEWHIRHYPRRPALEAWRRRLAEDGPTFETWAEMLAAYDGGWTLPCASPSQMTSLDQWHDVPDDVQVTIADFITAIVAGTLTPDGGREPPPPSSPTSVPTERPPLAPPSPLAAEGWA